MITVAYKWICPFFDRCYLCTICTLHNILTSSVWCCLNCLSLPSYHMNLRMTETVRLPKNFTQVFSVCPIQLAPAKINNRLLCRNNIIPRESNENWGAGGQICLRTLYNFLIWGNYHHPKLGPLLLLKGCLSKLENSWCLQFRLHWGLKQDYKEEDWYKNAPQRIMIMFKRLF